MSSLTSSILSPPFIGMYNQQQVMDSEVDLHSLFVHHAHKILNGFHSILLLTAMTLMDGCTIHMVARP